MGGRRGDLRESPFPPSLFVCVFPLPPPTRLPHSLCVSSPPLLCFSSRFFVCFSSHPASFFVCSTTPPLSPLRHEGPNWQISSNVWPPPARGMHHRLCNVQLSSPERRWARMITRSYGRSFATSLVAQSSFFHALAGIDGDALHLAHPFGER